MKLIKETEKKKNSYGWKRRLTSIIAGIVVFATTYALVLPAITLDDLRAANEPGLSMSSTTAENEEGLSADLETEAPIDPDTETGEENPVDVDNPETAAPEPIESEQPAAEIAQPEDSTPAPAESEEPVVETAQPEEPTPAEADTTEESREESAPATAETFASEAEHEDTEDIDEAEAEEELEGDPTADVETSADWNAMFAGMELTGNWSEDLLTVAQTQRGYTESQINYIVNDEGKHKGYTRYGAWYGCPYGDWCAMFVSFCLNYAEIPTSAMPREASCPRWVTELKAWGMYAEAADYIPVSGDLIFFDFSGRSASHVGIVYEVDEENGKLIALEGNSSDRVQYVRYDLDDGDIMGYGVMPLNPDYYSAQSFEAELDGVTVSVEADEFAFPKDTMMTAELVEDEAVLSAITDAVDGTVHMVQAVDITFLDHDWEEIEPRLPIRVTMSSAVVAEADVMQVVHVDDELQAEVVCAAKTGEDNTIAFDADSFSVYAVVLTERNTVSGTSLSAYLTYGEGTSSSQSVALTENGENEMTVPWTAKMTLHVDATFAEGSNKTIEITLPAGMTFCEDLDGAKYYQTSSLDGYLKTKITPPEQEDETKQNQTILGQNQYNGTMTLKFNSQGDDDNVSQVSFTVPVGVAYNASRRSGAWESGTAWFYDYVTDPVIVTQSIGEETNIVKIEKINITNDETKYYYINWTAPYYPEVLVGGTTTGEDIFAVFPNPGNEGVYFKKTAYKYYSITYLIPENAIFTGFSSKRVDGLVTGNYIDVEPVVTVVPEGQDSAITEWGDTVPAGYKAYTFTFNYALPDLSQLRACPIVEFPEEYFSDGDLVTISVIGVHAQYYGREYEEGQEETFESSKYPTLTYKIVSEYEEVFANTYQVKKLNDDGTRETNFYEADYNLYMGAPGFEHTQERLAGYFIIGNRGPKDSASKTITYEFDQGNTWAIGITQAEIPSLSSSEYSVTNIQYKTWNTNGNAISDWISYTGTANVINLKDLEIAGNSGVYIKAIRFDIDKIPKQSYLRNGKTTFAQNDHLYKFYCNVLTEEYYEIRKNVDAGDIVNVMTIANTNGNVQNASDTSGRSVTGKAYIGTKGTKLIYGNSYGYSTVTSLEVGQGSKTVLTPVNHYNGSQYNAQLIDKIYLISPFGEDFTNITAHYKGYWDRATIAQRPKTYLNSEDSPQPTITEVPNESISDSLRAQYPNAKYYILDFTSITGDQEKYDARQMGASVINSKSLENTPLSTDSDWNGIWISYDFSPLISDTPGVYRDITFVEFNVGDDITKVSYEDSSWWNVNGAKDSYELTDNPTQKHLGQMNGFILIPTEGLTVSSSAKQSDETDAFYRTYNGEGYTDNKTVLGMYDNADYKLEIKNESSLSVKGATVYFPIPKEGEDWGSIMNPDGAFNFSMSLKSGGILIPDGFKVYYCQNATVSNQYAQWDDSYTWAEQSQTTDWSQTDWNKVNFVRIVWKGTENKATIDYPDDYSFVFHLTVDTTATASDQMYKVNQWRPYFSRTYTAGTTWVWGNPVAAMLVPGFLQGTVWLDLNQNGYKDEGEDVVPGVHVQLWDLTDPENPVLRVDNQYTDEEGNYRFNGLIDGTAASGWVDNCRIVVINPSDDPDAENAVYGGFSTYTGTSRNQMSMTESSDHKTASVDATPGVETDGKYYDCGLIRPGGTLTVKLVVIKDDIFEISETEAFSIKVTFSDSESKTWLMNDQDSNYISAQTGVSYVVEATDAEDRGYSITYTGDVGTDAEYMGTIERGKNKEVVVTLTLKKIDITVLKKDEETQDTINGAEFELYCMDGERPEKIVSESVLPDSVDGVFTVPKAGFQIKGLPKGNYMLKEVKAPSGYIITNNSVYFTITANSVSMTTETITDPDTGVETTSQKTDESYASVTDKTLTVYNRAGTPLPNTGGVGTKLFTLGGMALIVLAAGMYGFGAKRRLAQAAVHGKRFQ